MEIKIPKEVRDYHENIFFGLNTRQFICSVLAVAVAVGIYFALQPYVGTEEIGWMCILGAAPFAACGFKSCHLDTGKPPRNVCFWVVFLYCTAFFTAYRTKSTFCPAGQLDRLSVPWYYFIIPTVQGLIAA